MVRSLKFRRERSDRAVAGTVCAIACVVMLVYNIQFTINVIFLIAIFHDPQPRIRSILVRQPDKGAGISGQETAGSRP